MTFSYDLPGKSAPLQVRPEIAVAHRGVWRRLAEPGGWWTGRQRIEIAAQVRAIRPYRTQPPSLRDVPSPSGGPLPPTAVRAARMVAVDAHRIDRKWCQDVTSELGDAAYVELVAIASQVTAIDVFAEALGIALEPLPEPVPGDPERATAPGCGDVGAFVPMRLEPAGPNVGRALSSVPNDNHSFFEIVGTMYALTDFLQLVWDRPLSRPQVELLAARTSAISECFY